MDRKIDASLEGFKEILELYQLHNRIQSVGDKHNFSAKDILKRRYS